jgi:Transposase/DDE superfamily endonuclease
MPKDNSQHSKHSSAAKDWFIGRVLAGQTVKKASDAENIPPGSASRIWQKYNKTGTTENAPRSGRPRVISDCGEHAVVWEACRSRRKTFKEIGNKMPAKPSELTVRRVLAKHNMHRRVAEEKPNLTERQKNGHNQFAEDYKDSGVIDFSATIYSDESYICADNKSGCVYVTQGPEEKFDEDCMVPTFSQSLVCIMVWGCIILGRKGPLVVLEYPGGKGGGMTAKRYQEQVLEPALLPFFKEMKEERFLVDFMQDGAPSHTAKSTKKWLKDNGIPLVDHPAKSPDLNAIKHAWHLLKNIIRSGPIPTNTQALIDAAHAAWEAIPQEKIDALISSMPDRVAAVLEAKGGHTHY